MSKARSGPSTVVHVPRRFVAEEWGGTETVILEISRQQQRAGLRPRIVTSMALAKLRHEEIGGIPVHRYPYCYPFFGLSDADRAALDKKGGNLLSISLFRAWLQIVPLRIGGGTRLKIPECMAMRTPVVSTTVGAQGLDLRHDHDILLADTPEEFARETVRALRDAALRSHIEETGFQTVHERLGWGRLGAKLAQDYSRRFA